MASIPTEALLPWLVRTPSREARREPDAATVLAEAERLALVWGEVLAGTDLGSVRFVNGMPDDPPDGRSEPAAWRGVELAPLLRYKAMGYNAGLFEWTRRAIRAAEAADTALAIRPGAGRRRGRRSLVSLAVRPGLFEHALAARLRERGGRLRLPFAARSPEARVRAAHPPRWTLPGHVPFEVELDPPAILADGAGGARPPGVDPPGPFDAIFLATMNNYLSPMIPTIARLRAEGVACLVVAPRAAVGWTNFEALPEDVPRVFLEELPAAFARDESPGPIHEAEIRAGRALRARWEARKDRLAERHRVRGVPLWPFVSEDVRHVATGLAPQAAALLELAALLLETTGARLLVVARLRRAVERSFHAIAARSGIRTAMLLHGHIGGGPDRRLDDGDFAGLDAVCLWLEEQKRRLLAGHEGLDPERLVVTGNPAWDGHAARATPEIRREKREELARRFGFEAGEEGRASLVVTLATQSIARSQFEAIARVFAESRLDPAPRLLVKVHPGESVEFYELMRERLRLRAAAVGAIREEVRRRTTRRSDSPSSGRDAGAGDESAFPIHVVPHGGIPLMDLLLGSDLLVTFSSTVNLESILLGTPVVTACLAPELAGQDRLVPLEQHGFPIARDVETLRREIESCAREAGRLAELRELARRTAGELHVGEAAARAARAILPSGADGAT